MTSHVTEHDLDILTRTVWGEARGEPSEGQAAVAHTVMNRVNARSWYGQTIAEVCLKPGQYACWNTNDVNYNKIKNLRTDSPDYQAIRTIVEQVVYGRHSDNTNGSKHYHVTGVPHSWAIGKTPVVIIGNHSFYNNID